jgi:hypothetical protein
MVSNPSTSWSVVHTARRLFLRRTLTEGVDGALAPAGLGAKLRSDSFTKRVADAGEGEGEVVFDEARFEAEEAVAEASQVAVAAGVGGLLAGVIGAIDLEDEVGGGSREVGDVVADWKLAAE